MKKSILFTFVLCLLSQWSVAQAPKWVEKAKRSVFSIVTYDKDDKIQNTGNGFFVTEDGVALSDYSLFKGAQRAVIINSEGEKMPVECILGANDMYDIIKFRVGITGVHCSSGCRCRSLSVTLFHSERWKRDQRQSEKGG